MRGPSIAVPRWPFATLGSPICPRRRCMPEGVKGAGNDAQPVCRSRPDGPVGTREAPRVQRATRLSTAGGQGPLEAAPTASSLCLGA
jgi:hypothetical protein